MFTLGQLKSRLESDGLTPDGARQLARGCEEMFFSDSQVPSFVAWAIFRTLSDLWDDDQAVPTAVIQPYSDRLLPELQKWVNSGDSFSDSSRMRAVVRVFSKCYSEASEAE